MVKVITFPAGSVPSGVIEVADETIPVEAMGLTPGVPYRVFVEQGTVTPQPVGPATLDMTQLPNNRTYQRQTDIGGSQGKGLGVVPVEMTTSGPTPVFARIRNVDGSELVAPFKVGDATVATVKVDVPVDARLGWMFIDLAPTSAGPWQEGTSRIGMGRGILHSGQSLCNRNFARMDNQTATMASLGVTIDPHGAVFATYTDNQRTVANAHWEIPADGSDYDSAFLGEFLRRQVAEHGVNCFIAGHTRGATTIAQYIPGGSESAKLRTIMEAIGGFEQLIWFQGHSDAAAGTTFAVYQERLDALLADVTTYNAVRGSNFQILTSAIPNINSSSWGTVVQRGAIRMASLKWATAKSGVYSQPSDIDLVDGVHQTQLGAQRIGELFHAAIEGTAVADLPLTDGVVVPTYGAGKFAQGMNGGVNRIASPVAPDHQFWTLEGWIKIAAAPTSAKVAAGVGSKGWFGVTTGGRLVACYTGPSAANDTYFNGTTAAGGGTNPVVSDNQWHHVALVSRGDAGGAAGAELYLDGVKIGTNTVVPFVGFGRGVFEVGTLDNTAGFTFPGQVDEVAMWLYDRYTANFTLPTATYLGSEVGLRALYHLDGNPNSLKAG